VTAWFMGVAGINGAVAILLGILVGAGVGLINGLLVTRLNLNAFITTLSVGFVLNGLILVITGGWAIQGIPASVQRLGQGSLLRVPLPVLAAVLVGIAIAVILHFTRLGRHVFAVGGNRDAAELAGVPTNRIRVYMFV